MNPSPLLLLSSLPCLRAHDPHDRRSERTHLGEIIDKKFLFVKLLTFFLILIIISAKKRACGITVIRDHGMVESGVRFPAGPQKIRPRRIL